MLMAANKHIAARCAEQNAAFMKCKREDPNPEVCLEKGAAVTGCVVNLCVPASCPAPPLLRLRALRSRSAYNWHGHYPAVEPPSPLWVFIYVATVEHGIIAST